MTKRDIVTLFIRLLAVFLAVGYIIDFTSGIGQSLMLSNTPYQGPPHIVRLVLVIFIMRMVVVGVVWASAPALARLVDVDSASKSIKATVQSIVPAALSVVGVVVSVNAVYTVTRALMPGYADLARYAWQVFLGPALQLGIGIWLVLRPKYAVGATEPDAQKIS